jgi:hypothetical protein
MYTKHYMYDDQERGLELHGHLIMYFLLLANLT